MWVHEAVAEGNSLFEARPATMLESLDKYKDSKYATKHSGVTWTLVLLWVNKINALRNFQLYLNSLLNCVLLHVYK